MWSLIAAPLARAIKDQRWRIVAAEGTIIANIVAYSACDVLAHDPDRDGHIIAVEHSAANLPPRTDEISAPARRGFHQSGRYESRR
jgi:hypothetical protein